MRLIHRHLIDFINGRGAKVACVAELPRNLGRHLKTDVEDILLRLDYSDKLRHDHRLLPHHFYQLQPAIDRGWVGISRGDLLFLYEDHNVFHKTFKLIVKTTARRHELWIKTFFKIDAEDIPPLKAKAIMIRDHLE